MPGGVVGGTSAPLKGGAVPGVGKAAPGSTAPSGAASAKPGQAQAIPGGVKGPPPGSTFGSSASGGGAGADLSSFETSVRKNWQAFRSRFAWYTGPPKNFNGLAALVRNGFFSLLGDLSGFPYNSLIVQGGSVLVTCLGPDGSPAAGVEIQGFVVGPQGQTGVTVTGTSGSDGTILLELNATMNITYPYSVTVQALLEDGTPYGLTTIETTGNQVYGGIAATLNLAQVASGGSVAVFVYDASGGVAGARVAVTVSGGPAVEGGQAAIATGEVTTNSKGNALFAIPSTVQYLAGDTYNVLLSITGGGTGQSTTPVAGSVLAGEVVATVLLTPKGAESGGPPAGYLVFNFRGSDVPTDAIQVSVYAYPQGDAQPTGGVTGTTSGKDASGEQAVTIQIPASMLEANSGLLLFSFVDVDATGFIGNGVLSAPDLGSGGGEVYVDVSAGTVTTSGNVAVVSA